MATTIPIPPSAREAARPVAPHRRTAIVGRWLFRLMVVGLLTLNAAMFARDGRAVPDLKTLRGRVDSGRFLEAEPGLRETLRRSPHADEARMLLARSLAGQKRTLACAEQLHRVPFWSLRKPEARFLEGQAFLEVGQARPAEAALRACIEDSALHPTPEDYHKAATELLIELYATEERWADAQDVVWRMYRRVGPIDRPAAIIMWLRTEVERIEPKTTVVRLRRYVAVDPEDIEARRALAKAEEALGNEAEATRQIRLAVESLPSEAHPVNSAAWRDWLKILRHQNNAPGMAEVVARLPQTSAIDNDPDLWEYRGMVREAAGDLPGAAEAYRRAVAGRPNDEDFHYRLALVENRLGRREPADDHLARSKVLRAARGKLLDAFLAYRDAVNSDVPSGERLTHSAAELAGLCRTLGLAKVAEALAENHPQKQASATQ